MQPGDLLQIAFHKEIFDPDSFYSRNADSLSRMNYVNITRSSTDYNTISASMPSQVSPYSKIEEFSETFMEVFLVILLVYFCLAILLGVGLSQLWTLIFVMQIFGHLLLLKVQIPANL